MTKSVIVGTAGHIDHGKSSLVEALTGVHPDRLKEEQERGITIDLGFASLQPDSCLQVGFVDVPGHERFIKNMLAGVGGIDVVLLVVAADESIMPQTREHFDICRLLNIQSGLVAVTKADLVNSELLELVRLEVREFLRGSFLETAPIVPVSAKSGLDLSALKESLLKVCAAAPSRQTDAVFRLPVDRCFTLRGFGTVVTGTLVSGTLRKADEVEIYPSRIRARIRGIEVHSTPVEQAFAGQRTAVNLINVEVNQIHRGMEVSVPDRFSPVSTCSAKIDLLASSPAPLTKKTQTRFHLGTAELMATLKPLAREPIQPGQSGFVRIQLDRRILMLPGDRFIFRRLSPMETLGGGTVLDVEPGKLRGTGQAIKFLRSIESLNLSELICCLADRNGLRGLDESELLSQTTAEKHAVRDLIKRLAAQGRLKLVSEEPYQMICSAAFGQLMDAIIKCLETFHRQNPLMTGIPREQLYSGSVKGCRPLAFRAALSELAEKQKVEVDNDLVRLAGTNVVLSQAEAAAKARIAEAFQEAGWKVPAVDEVLVTLSVPRDEARKLVALLVKEGRLIKISENLIFHSETIQRLRQLLSDYKKQSNRIDIGKFKDLTEISRKYAIPLLEFLDRERVTRRVGDSRLIL
jgi:selenocysteine-specific elongation factor